MMARTDPAPLTFTLPLDDVNKIMLALAQRPFVEVAELIAEMQRQAAPQLPALPSQPQALQRANGEAPAKVG
jgi:hypothetical protein